VFSEPEGGWSFGPRYLILIVPLLLDSLFDGEIFEMSNLWHGLWFGISLVFCTLPALTFPFAPPEFTAPHRDFWLKFLIDDHWYMPNLANVAGAPSSMWTMLPVFALLALAVFIVLRNMRRPKRFLVGLIAAAVFIGAYLVTPSRFQDPEYIYERATIAERFFAPAGRLTEFKANAESMHDTAAIQRIRHAEWLIADSRSYAPSDWPYGPVNELSPGPSEVIKEAAAAESSGDIESAVSLLKKGNEQFDFARCELSTDLAYIYNASGRRDDALAELESIQSLVDRTSTPDCMRSQFLLGTVYHELDRPADSDREFNSFIVNSEGTTDQQLLSLRKQLGK
jgi:hypothetical protein